MRTSIFFVFFYLNISHCQKQLDATVFFNNKYYQAPNLDSPESNHLGRNLIQLG